MPIPDEHSTMMSASFKKTLRTIFF